MTGNFTPLPQPQLEHIAELFVQITPPIEAGDVMGLNSRGRRRIIPITGGTVTGKLQGKVLAGGADFQIVVSDTCADLDARYMLELDDGARVYIINRALRRAAAEDVQRLINGELVPHERVYFRCTPTFEVSDPKYQWLTESIFVGTGARFPDHVRISFFRVM